MEGELLADQPLGQKLIKKWFWLYFFMMITAPVGYIIKVIVSNTLSVSDVWIFYSVLGFVGLVSIYHDLGLTEALQYFLPKYWIEKKYNSYKTIIVITLLAQVAIGTAIACLIYFWWFLWFIRKGKTQNQSFWLGKAIRTFAWPGQSPRIPLKKRRQSQRVHDVRRLLGRVPHRSQEPVRCAARRADPPEPRPGARPGTGGGSME